MKELGEFPNVSPWTLLRNQTFFQQYFNSCAPDSCQYTNIQRHDFFLYIITSLIGLFGGLSSILRIIVPILLNTI
jgi:hypothetical protein